MPRKIETDEDRGRARAYGRWWYQQNADHVKARKDARHDEIRQWFLEYKSMLACEHYGENAPIVLDFHHRDVNAKDLSLTQAVHNGWSTERRLQEIEKCDVLCANCHQRLHRANSNR